MAVKNNASFLTHILCNQKLEVYIVTINVFWSTRLNKTNFYFEWKKILCISFPIEPIVSQDAYFHSGYCLSLASEEKHRNEETFPQSHG